MGLSHFFFCCHKQQTNVAVGAVKVTEARHNIILSLGFILKNASMQQVTQMFKLLLQFHKKFVFLLQNKAWFGKNSLGYTESVNKLFCLKSEKSILLFPAIPDSFSLTAFHSLPESVLTADIDSVKDHLGPGSFDLLVWFRELRSSEITAQLFHF